ncbi:MAG TPA: hypothetical protein VEI57_10580 [Nitrospirota bacterium]|nr:hypothetical protein [Nitrospirota bacterium]
MLIGFPRMVLANVKGKEDRVINSRWFSVLFPGKHAARRLTTTALNILGRGTARGEIFRKPFSFSRACYYPC